MVIFNSIDLCSCWFLDIFICGFESRHLMHDTEPDTFLLRSWPEKFSDMLQEIGVESTTKEIGTDQVEQGDYYSRYYAQTPRMITNKGCLEVQGSNIDVIQIIQKG